MIVDVRVSLLLLLATGGFLLLITWANATNLCLVRAERLRHEIAVAYALGATNRHLARRFLSEGVLLSALAGVIGFATGAAAVRAHFGWRPGELPRIREVGGVNAAV